MSTEGSVDFGRDLFPGDALHRYFARGRQSGGFSEVRLLGLPAYLLTRHEDVVGAFRDVSRFPPPDIYRLMFEPIVGRTFQTMEGEEHRRHRRLATPAFRASAVKTMDALLMKEVAHELLDELEGESGEVDLVSRFTRRYPFLIITRMLGIPRDREADFHGWARALLEMARDPMAAARASEAFTDELSPIVTERRREPREDIISDLVTAEIDGVGFTDEEVYAHVRLIFSAGASTTHDALGNLLWHLLRRPSLLERVRARAEDRPRLIEESLRFEPSVAALPRTSGPEPLVYEGHEVPPHSIVILGIASANRDPAVFEDPDSFDIDRSRGGLVTTFGPGARACPGMHLAKKQLEVVLDCILERVGHTELVESTEQPVGVVQRGPSSLLVRLG